MAEGAPSAVNDIPMTRISGIHILIASIVLWGLAVWLLDAPPPSSAQTPAATETAATEAAAGAAAGRRIGVSGSVQGETTAASTPSAPAEQTLPASSDSAPAAESASLQARAGAASAPPSSDPPPVATTATREPTAATGDGSRLALAPATTGSTASHAPATGAQPAPGSPTLPPVPETGGAGDDTVGPGLSPWTRPGPWGEHPGLRPPPPTGARGGVPGGHAIAGQINAARRAAWEGRLADSVAHYRAAARLQPDHHVVWGEMGNVLWAMRRWSEAAYALEGAATLLVRAGELRAASELVPAVGRIDPDAAYRIQSLLFATAQRRSG